MFSVLLIFLLFADTFARKGFGPGEQEWGYAKIRNSANLFWWLYYTTADVEKPTDRPLIVWLQGGPGGSSTGIGNFQEIGPIDKDLNRRNSTWVQHANILFIDSPVGTGFSYVDNATAYTTNNTQVAEDVISFFAQFYRQFPDFKSVPLYIFAESYGGKAAVEIALLLDKAAKAGEMVSNIKGVGLGDSWISPIDYVSTWAPYLLTMGIVDKEGFDKIMVGVRKVKHAVDSGNYMKATFFWQKTEEIIINTTNGVSFYNILTKINSNTSEPKELRDSDLMAVMKKVKKALHLIRPWGKNSRSVFTKHYGDFMKPATKTVEELLNSTGIKVAVYNGQLDLITDTPGTLNWVEKIHFSNKTQWEATPRKPFAMENYNEGYVKKYGNFAFYWVIRAGHLVPEDNPLAMYYILKDVTNNFTC